MDETAPTGGISEEDRLALADAMAGLPADQRACVALCLADGWSHSDAAEALGLPLGTVKSHVARGRARLLAALTGGSDDA
ncbi:RNA polymerase sigma factor [Brevundimonas sp. DC300-4]|uniref:RNA polymerase sigma factor n=1 Tax=Brevundimonas sp. DC300-4 TaxID=2804594 RepID=UPI003CF264D7